MLGPLCNQTVNLTYQLDRLQNSVSGFYLGYLRGRSFPPKMPSFPPQKILSLQYIGNYIGKLIQTRQGPCTHCNISQNCVSKCTRLHLRVYSFLKISRAACPPDPPRNIVPFGHSELLPQTINPRQNPVYQCSTKSKSEQIYAFLFYN